MQGIIYQLLFNHTTEWYTALESISTGIGAVSTFVASIVGIIILYIALLSLRETRKMVVEMEKQRELQEEPAVSVKIVPDISDLNLLNIIIRNTGGGPAYDVSVKFDPDLPYEETTLNQLKIFNKNPLIDKDETIEFFFASAIEYFHGGSPKATTATIEYYKLPQYFRKSNQKPFVRIVYINILEREGQLQIKKRNIHDLVNEIEELKQGVLIVASDLEKLMHEKNDR